MESGDLAGMVVAVFFLSLCIGLPTWMHYRTKMLKLRVQQGLPTADMHRLWETARRMEERIGYLETVLDSEVPGWRNRSGMR